MKQRVIFHIDVNSAFLSWEAVYRIHHLGGMVDLRTIPSAVGGDQSKRHGIILAKSIPAKKYDIKTGEPVTEALRKCPNLTLVPPNYSLYETNSKAFLEILREYSPCVEQYSIDEAFMDMSGMESLLGSLPVVAGAIKDRVSRELGFSINVGVSSNKLLAKMASDFQKPNRVHTLFPDEIPKKMWPLPVSDLFFVGRATTKKLHTLGIHTIKELAAADPAVLKAHMHKHGQTVWEFANGEDVSIVEKEEPGNKGYGNSSTIAFDVCDPGTARMVLLSLAETVGRRLRKDGVKAEVVAVAIKTSEFTHTSHQCTLFQATNITNEIHAAASQLFDELWDGSPIRHLGIHTGRISKAEDARQLSLFDTVDYEKLQKLDAAVDTIRLRYGNDAIKRAAFIQTDKIDHMSGGISREKRSVDYQKEKVM